MITRLLLILAGWTVCLSAHGDDSSSNMPDAQDIVTEVLRDVQTRNLEGLKVTAPEDIPILEKATKDSSADSRLYLALALCYSAVGNNAANLTNTEKAYNLAPNDPTSEQLYIISLKIAKQPLKALEVAQSFAAQNPQTPLASIQVANLAIVVQKYDDAIPILQALLKDPRFSTPPNSNVLQWNLGVCYLYKGDRAKAIEVLQAASHSGPPMATVLYSLGEAYLKSGDLQQANDAFEQVLAINPAVPRALYYQGLILEKNGDAAKAEANFTKAYDTLKSYSLENGEDFYLAYLICAKLGKPDEGEKNKAEAATLAYTYEAPWGK